MKLAFIGTGKIIADALFAIEPIKEIEKMAIFARPHSKEKAEAFAKQYNIAEVYTCLLYTSKTLKNFGQW